MKKQKLRRRAPALLMLLLGVAASSLSAQVGGDVKLENQWTRVLQRTEQPHQKSMSREHPMNRILVFRDAGAITFTTGSKVEKMEFKAGDVRWSPAGAAYVSENVTDHPIEIVEIEVRNKPKDPPLVLSKLDAPTSDAEHYKIVFENDQVRVLHVYYGPHSKGGLHEHVRDRAVVNLDAGNRAKYGDLRMAGAATHAEENETDQAAERLAVEFK